MIDLRASHRYARALLELAAQREQLDLIDDQLLAVLEVVRKYPEISNLISNSTITIAEKEDFIGKIIPPETLPLLLNFLKVLIKKKRFSELSFIQGTFHRLYEKKRRVEEVVAVSAVPLSAANAARLEKVLEAKLRSDIRLTTETDPTMIGGLILRFGGNEMNASFKSRLETLRQRLMA